MNVEPDKPCDAFIAMEFCLTNTISNGCCVPYHSITYHASAPEDASHTSAEEKVRRNVWHRFDAYIASGSTIRI
eukprot:CAMPEP_0178927482 /NCGR_PEP_ID=MMETSP0786-20121207/19219_1 /TAXON_ID=186022 /ORGANISM="Thalassionema frauenfeldii, Strain CCMP 1798" /LENGTH=73 /DNA_ID=CAMNT_0020602933 /DNA_START=150 /DNA_END=371 /DNA_ORIENTATION=-